MLNMFFNTFLKRIFVPFIIYSYLQFFIANNYNNIVYGFNIDAANPLYRFGPRGTLFGFSLAQHFSNEDPVLIVGAPRAESGQPGTSEAGAVFVCPLSFNAGSISEDECSRLQVEYPTQAEFLKRPQKLNSRTLHPEGKDHQLLGFVVQSTGQRHGQAMVCAPLLRYGLNAYTDGACYLLNSALNHTGVISTCNPLPKKDRHNDYGACEQGFSGYIDKNVILTGLPGARKWTGGVFGRYEFTQNGFPDAVDRWTMEVNKEHNGIINILASHDYLGYSVRYGRFGFWYEEAGGSNFTIVSGATRYQQRGAVVFLPFRKNSHPEEERLLGLDNNFTIVGQQLGSGFGAAIEVLDLNADGFDDLIVSAPFEFYYEEDIEFGGAVYIYYSAGRRQMRGLNADVFLDSIVLRIKGAHAQFGAALTKLGNLDNDMHGYQDFAVGAPQAHDGQGAVFIYSGAERDLFSTKPIQEIHADTLRLPKVPTDFTSKPKKSTDTLRNFGASLSGGVDLDNNHYGELAVGAFGSDAIVLFRTRSVVDVELGHTLPQQYIKIDNQRSCPTNARTCFSVTTSLSTSDRNNTAELLNFNEDPFICTLELVSYAKGVTTRGLFMDRNRTLTSWACGRSSVRYAQEEVHKVYVPQINQDWTHPLRFNFSVSMRERRSTELLPIINQLKSELIFDVPFDKKCGEDNDCHTDLSLSAILLNITRREDGKYITKVTERDMIVIRFVVKNNKERAFLAKLFIEYDQNELDEPQQLSHKSIDIERKESGLAVLALGNPLEKENELKFDLAFNLVRGSSERVSTSLKFRAIANSTSIEVAPEDNNWEAEVQLIKEADLQLNGASTPLIVRFSKGNKHVTDEMDIGQMVVHAYTLTNHGPFYARNVTVTINWPIRLNTEREDDWSLYTLEEPVIRHNGEVRRCRSDLNTKAINPLNIYNDEMLKLTYDPSYRHQTGRRTRRNVVKNVKHSSSTEAAGESSSSYGLVDLISGSVEVQTRANSIFDSEYIKPKEIEESSGARVRIVDVNCKDNTAVCVPIICHFDYVGTDEAALIEIRARLWNYTFSGDYRAVEYIALTSDGFVEVDLAQGIFENIENNFAKVTTHAYPDRPSQEDRLDIWIVLLAVLVGLLLLGILMLICWRCGFFKRKRHDMHLHQAQYRHEMDRYYSEM